MVDVVAFATTIASITRAHCVICNENFSLIHLCAQTCKTGLMQIDSYSLYMCYTTAPLGGFGGSTRD